MLIGGAQHHYAVSMSAVMDKQIPVYIAPHYKTTTVTSTTPDLKNLPLPSPDIDKVLRELKDTKTLSKDGASAEALEHALIP